MPLIFDTVLYGSRLRAARRGAGYKRAADFAAAVNAVTGHRVASRDVVYKIEQGRQEPTASQMVAFAMTLHPGSVYQSLIVDLDHCLPRGGGEPCR